MEENEVVGRHSFVFNREDNGGEALCVVTKIIANGDPGGYFTTQDISLQSYCNCATLHIQGFLTPSALRELANQLDSEIEKAKVKLK